MIAFPVHLRSATAQAPVGSVSPHVSADDRSFRDPADSEVMVLQAEVNFARWNDLSARPNREFLLVSLPPLSLSPFLSWKHVAFRIIIRIINCSYLWMALPRSARNTLIAETFAQRRYINASESAVMHVYIRISRARVCTHKNHLAMSTICHSRKKSLDIITWNYLKVR